MSGADRHGGDRLAALADGRLAEPKRGRVLDHVSRCARCRTEYDSQLAMKGLLRGLGEPGAPVDLRARLSGLASAPVPPPGRPARRSTRPARRTRRTARSARQRAGRAGAGVLSVTVLALAGAYALGGAPAGSAVTPPIDRYVREHAAVSGGLPLTEPVLWQLPAGSTVPQAGILVRLRTAPASFGANRSAP